MKDETSELRIVALDYAWRTASQVGEAAKPYTQDQVLGIAREYLTFLQGEKKAAA